MKLRNAGICLGLIATLAISSSTAHAGGLYLREFGQPSQGTAGAGANALAEDASVAFNNPSSVFHLDSDSKTMITGIVLDSSAEFDPNDQTTVTGGDGGDGGDTLFGGAAFHARKLNEDLGLTFALTSISGSALDYDNDFVGRYTGHEVELMTVTFTPSIAYKATDSLAFSLGVPLTYGQLDLEAAIPPLMGPSVPARDGRAKISDGDDFAPTVAASATWQATPDLRFGLGYIYETELEFDSDLEVTLPGAGGGTTIGNVASDVELVIPQSIAASFIYEFCGNWALLGRFGWEDWSSLDSVPVTTSATGAAVPLNWEDVYSGSLGFRYQPNADWTLYTGVGYDSDPTGPEDRIAILPADEQIRIAGGFTYAISDTQRFGMALTYIDLGNAPIDNTTGGGRVSGDYETNRLVILGLNYGWG